MYAASIDDLRILAQRRLPRFLFDYVDGGSYAETTLRQNIHDLTQINLRQRVLRNVVKIDLSVDLFAQNYKLPVILAPVGLAGMYARRGETQAVRAAGKAGVQMCLSTVSLCTLEEVRAAQDAGAPPIWFQLYMLRDRGFVQSMLQRAQESGCSTLVFTVDLPVPGARYRDLRSGLSGPPGLRGAWARLSQILTHPDWAFDVGLHGGPHTLGNVAPMLQKGAKINDFLHWIGRNFDASCTWEDIAWIRQNWKGNLLIKGILEKDDALAALDCGADGIIVSNHGGRQLDGVASGARALPPIADAVGDRMVVLADGGVRSGLDVVRLCALGARAVMIGRAWAYGLAAGGEAGVERCLEIIRAEMLVAMALTGCTNMKAVNREIVAEHLSS